MTRLKCNDSLIDSQYESLSETKYQLTLFIKVFFSKTFCKMKSITLRNLLESIKSYDIYVKNDFKISSMFIQDCNNITSSIII